MGTVICVRCKEETLVTRVDLVGNGYRCEACSGAALIEAQRSPLFRPTVDTPQLWMAEAPSLWNRIAGAR